MSEHGQRFLVLGAFGCIGAWTVRVLREQGVDVVAADLPGDPHRLRLVLETDDLSDLPIVPADVTDRDGLCRLLDELAVTHVVHLAALQVPFCRENPSLGAQVNVAGTVNVFEAVRALAGRIQGFVYASSAAVYSAQDRGADGIAPERGRFRPNTLYGVYKVANEETARVYWQDWGVASVGLRPYVVYGPGRDQGVTSTPTQAMRAAARGESFQINYGGASQFQHARDVAGAFVAAARSGASGAESFNLPGPRVRMGEVVAAIEAAVPEAAGRIGFDDVQPPFPEELEARGLEALSGPLSFRPLEQGVRETVEHFRRADG